MSSENTGKRKSSAISIKWRFVLMILLVQIPFYWLFTYVGKTAVYQVNRQIAGSQQTTLNAFVAGLDKQMLNTNQLLFSTYWAGESFPSAAKSENSKEITEILQAELEEAQDFVELNDSICALIFRQEKAGFQQLVVNTASAPDGLNALLKQVGTRLPQINLGWFLASCSGRTYYLRCCDRDGMQCIAVMDLTDITYRTRINYQLTGSVVFSDGTQLLTESYWSPGLANGITQDREGDRYGFVSDNGRRYIITQANFAGLTLLYGTEYLQSMDWWKITANILLLCILLSFGVSIIYLYLTILRPLNQLVRTMREIQHGNTQLRTPLSKSREFSGISETFNSMLDTLGQLKISVYESQLQARKSEIDALRLQIRRHFFLNCLKNIYAMASSGEIEDVKQTALLLSENLRYTLDFKKDAIDLATELQMCKDYIELQGIGQERKPSLALSVDAGLEDFRVPPVSILTLLENCCKYAAQQDCALKITISASRRMLDMRNYVSLSVQDNGPGFTPEMLKLLNNDMNGIQQDGHIGLSNTTLRMKMMYGQECQALYMNRNGARIEWIIPTDNITKESGNEITDC